MTGPLSLPNPHSRQSLPTPHRSIFAQDSVRRRHVSPGGILAHQWVSTPSRFEQNFSSKQDTPPQCALFYHLDHPDGLAVCLGALATTWACQPRAAAQTNAPMSWTEGQVTRQLRLSQPPVTVNIPAELAQLITETTALFYFSPTCPHLSRP